MNGCQVLLYPPRPCYCRLWIQFQPVELTDSGGNQRAKDRLSDDFYQISHWVNETPKPVVFVLNKEDKLTDKVFKGSARLAKIKDAALRSEPVVQGRSAIGPSNFHMVVGSLSDKTKAQGLVASVFSELEND